MADSRFSTRGGNGTKKLALPSVAKFKSAAAKAQSKSSQHCLQARRLVKRNLSNRMANDRPGFQLGLIHRNTHKASSNWPLNSNIPVSCHCACEMRCKCRCCLGVT